MGNSAILLRSCTFFNLTFYLFVKFLEAVYQESFPKTLIPHNHSCHATPSTLFFMITTSITRSRDHEKRKLV